MRHKTMHVALIGILLTLFIVPLSAGITAEYNQMANPTLEILSDLGRYTNSVGFKVGTLRLDITGNNNLPKDLEDLELNRVFHGDEDYINLITNPPKRTVKGHLVSRITYDEKQNKKKIVPIENDDDNPELLEEDEIEKYDTEKYGQYKKLYPIVVEFFIVVKDITLSENIGLQFARGHSIGNFSVDFGMRIPFADGSRNIPFTPSEFNEASGSDSYINNPKPNFTRYVQLDIVDKIPSIALNEAYYPAIFSQPVAKAQITLTGNYSPTNNSIYISFTSENGKSNEEFHLWHQSPNIETYIPFRLFFGDSLLPVEYGVPNNWSGLTNGTTFTKNLHVGWIEEQAVLSSMGGVYSETIYVNITPTDTIP